MIELPERGLIIRKEHLDKILDGDKVWEMRSRPTKMRGRIALIEAGSGMVVGECDLTYCQEPLEDWEREPFSHLHCVDDISLLEKWRHPWVMQDALRYDNPIPYDHPKGAVIWVKLGKVAK